MKPMTRFCSISTQTPLEVAAGLKTLNGETSAIRPNASPATTASIRVAPSRVQRPARTPGPSATSST